MDCYQETRRSQVPAFGSWDYSEHGLPFTQCFDSARQPGFVRYPPATQERDLYVTGDLYQNDVVTPAVIVVPRHRRKGGHAHAKKQRQVEQQHEQQEWGWESAYNNHYSSHDIVKPLHYSPAPETPAFKAVDEDLYKIPSDLLRPRPKRKGGFGFFSSCLMPICV